MNVNKFINDAKKNGERNMQAVSEPVADDPVFQGEDFLFWDDLGSATVLTRKGQVLQLIGDEI